MSPSDPTVPEPSSLAARLGGAPWRLVAIAAALAFGAAAYFGRLDAWIALAGFVAVVGAALVPSRRRALSPSAAAAAPHGGEAGDRLASIIAALPEPALVVDRRGNVSFANARIEAAIGAPRIGEPLSFTLRAPEILDAARAVLTGAAARSVEFQARVPVDRWYEAHIVPVRFAARSAPDAAGPPDIVLVLLRDLTQQRRLEQMRVDFVANASHELRTPLAAMLGFIETLQGPARNDTAARNRFLAIMAEQARRMARLIDDLLSLSRIELNVHIRPDKLVDLVLVAREVVDAMAPLAAERETELRLVRRQDSLPVRGDRDELIRVCENLVENALKYGASPKGVDVICDAAQREDGVREATVSVVDYGPGIAPEHLPRLTERFYRVDVTRSREQGGTGLGLAIVKHIVNRHRARLTIASEAGRGTTFAIHFALAEAR